MSNADFLYRPVLQQLTQVIKKQGLDPYDAYGWLYERQLIATMHPQTYLSTSITSGGHARDTSLDMLEIITRNVESARLLAEQLAADKQLAPQHAVEPVFVGKTGWTQAEYIELWLSVIGGFTLNGKTIDSGVRKLRRFVKQAQAIDGLNLELMNSNASAEERAIEYFKMSGVFAGLITSGQLKATPIATVIRMIDTETSLGAQTERVFARQIKSKVMDISVVKPALPSDLEIVNHVLAVDTARLIKFGATVFDTRNNQARLLLTEVPV